MVVGNGPRLLRAFYEPLKLAEALEHPPSLDALDAADEETRLTWIAGLTGHLASTGCTVEREACGKVVLPHAV